MSAHTIHNPERLEFRASQYEANTFTIGTEDGDWLMSVRHSGEQFEARQIANMARLVGCWNALHDLPQDAIMGGWTRAGLEAHGIALTAERDALRADAERYRYLRSKQMQYSLPNDTVALLVSDVTALDATMEETK